MAIDSVQVCDNIGSRWGVTVKDYTLNGVQTDLQDLLVAVSKQRANAVEQEVTPLSKRMEARNEYLNLLGTALSELTEIQASFASDAKGSDKASKSLTSPSGNLVYKLSGTLTNPPSKQETEKYIQLVKSAIDGANSDAQADMTRLQSLVDRRDEAYSTATNLMTDVSDTRSNSIRNM